MIFMTSNLGATEMGQILRPNLGFAAGEYAKARREGKVDADLTDKISRAGVEAARRSLPRSHEPDRQDRWYSAAGEPELRKILTLELNILQQRIFSSSTGARFVFSLTTDSAKDYLLVKART